MSMFGADLPCPDNGKADPVSRVITSGGSDAMRYLADIF